MSRDGIESEAEAREIAGDLGLPDFVYVPADEKKGGATREVSDGLLVCNGSGLILQVKTRKKDTDEPSRAESWIRKKVKEGLGQARGTRRRLAMSKIGTFRSLRGYDLELSAVAPWLSVVIVNHPSIPAGLVIDAVDDAIWMSLDDWYGLNERLLSTKAVIAYVARAVASGINPSLGMEEARYDLLAEADQLAPGPGFPLLPRRSFTEEELKRVNLYGELV